MNRSKARRNQGIKQSQGRVVDLSDAAHFEKLSKKYADRLLVLHAYTVYVLRSLKKYSATTPLYSVISGLQTRQAVVVVADVRGSVQGTQAIYQQCLHQFSVQQRGVPGR